MPISLSKVAARSGISIAICFGVFGGSLRAQTVGLSDVNVGLRSDDNVLAVQSHAIAAYQENETAFNRLASERANFNSFSVKAAEPLNISSSTLATAAERGENWNELVQALEKGPPRARANAQGVEEAQNYYSRMLMLIPKINRDAATVSGAVDSQRNGKEIDHPTIQSMIRYDFVDNNSFIGKGVLATQQTDIGTDIITPFGLELLPYFSYAHASDTTATSRLGSNLLGGTISLNQKVYPFRYGYPNIFHSFADDTPLTVSAYPGYDMKAGIDLNFGSTYKYTYKAGAGSGLTQDQYALFPNATVDFYLSDRFSVSLIPGYQYSMSSTDQGGTGSGGIFQLQDRNSYTLISTPKSKLQITELNTLERDVNQEPLPPAANPIVYQTWAKFGAAVNYTYNSRIYLTAQYSYEAFNENYEAQYVTAQFKYQF